MRATDQGTIRLKENPDILLNARKDAREMSPPYDRANRSIDTNDKDDVHKALGYRSS